MRRYLIVGNQTLAGAHLVAKVKDCLAAGACRFHVVVPATPPRLMTPPQTGRAEDIARARLDQAVERLSALDAQVTGEVGDERVMQAITQVLRRERFDEIILSTLPHGTSAWLLEDLPRRLSEAFATPVTHLVARPVEEPEARTRASSSSAAAPGRRDGEAREPHGA